MSKCRGESQENWYAEILELIYEPETGILFHQNKEKTYQLRNKNYGRQYS